MKPGKKSVKNLVGFLGDLKTLKFHSEINWPLIIMWIVNVTFEGTLKFNVPTKVTFTLFCLNICDQSHFIYLLFTISLCNKQQKYLGWYKPSLSNVKSETNNLSNEKIETSQNKLHVISLWWLCITFVWPRGSKKQSHLPIVTLSDGILPCSDCA